jgi:hypothetical protein
MELVQAAFLFFQYIVNLWVNIAALSAQLSAIPLSVNSTTRRSNIQL